MNAEHVHAGQEEQRRIPFFGFVTAFFFFFFTTAVFLFFATTFFLFFATAFSFFLSFPAVLGLDPVFLRVDLGFDLDSGLESAVESEFRSLAVVVRFL